MPIGYEQSHEREAFERLISRKQGDNPRPSVTRAHAAYDADLHHIIHTLQQAEFPQYQNADGTFPYLAGYDGPSE